MSENEITKQVIELYSNQSICEKENHNIPAFQIQHENRHQYCWGCLSEEIKKQRNSKSQCDLCYGFVKDWLDLPLFNSDIFYNLQSNISLQRFIPLFAKGLLQWLGQVCDLDDSFLMRNIHNYFEQLYKYQEYSDIPDELKWATAMLKGCLESPFRDDIKYWIDMATDYGVIYDYEDIPLWTSLWFWRIWNAVPTIHAEHMGWKSISYAGPALGMTPLPIASNPNGTNVCLLPSPSPSPVPSAPKEQRQESWILLEEEEEELLEFSVLDS